MKKCLFPLPVTFVSVFVFCCRWRRFHWCCCEHIFRLLWLLIRLSLFSSSDNMTIESAIHLFRLSTHQAFNADGLSAKERIKAASLSLKCEQKWQLKRRQNERAIEWRTRKGGHTRKSYSCAEKPSIRYCGNLSPLNWNSPWIRVGDHRCIGYDSNTFSESMQNNLSGWGRNVMLGEKVTLFFTARTILYVFHCQWFRRLLFLFPFSVWFLFHCLCAFFLLSIWCLVILCFLHPNMVSVITITIVRERIGNCVFSMLFLVDICVDLCWCVYICAFVVERLALSRARECASFADCGFGVHFCCDGLPLFC